MKLQLIRKGRNQRGKRCEWEKECRTDEERQSLNLDVSSNIFSPTIKHSWKSQIGHSVDMFTDSHFDLSWAALIWFERQVLPESFLQVSPLQRVGHCRCWLRLPQSHGRSHLNPIGPNSSHVTRSGMITLTGWIFKGPPRWMRVRA